MTFSHPRAGAVGPIALVLLFGPAACAGAYLTMPPSNPPGAALPAAADEPPAGGAARAAKPEKLRVYIGTYTSGGSKGIYLSELDLASGALSPPALVGETPNPSFVSIHPSGRYLFAVNEVGNFQGQKSGSVTAFAVDPKSGRLTQLNQQSSHGDGPCFITVDRTGRNVLVANYGGGSIAALPVGADGRLGEATAAIQHQGSSVDKGRQEGPHAHSINLDKANRFAFAADLGLDKVLVYRFSPAKGTLTPNDPPAASVPPGSGPRHFAFHPDGRYAYVINEMTSTVTAFSYDSKAGTLTSLQTLSTLPEGFKGNNSTAEVQVHPSGKFVYGSNRGHNSIAIFRIDPKTGQLTPAGHQPTGGKTPRNFGIDPTGTFLLAANQDTGNVVVFRINPETGQLSPTGHSIEVPMAVCVKMTPLPR